MMIETYIEQSGVIPYRLEQGKIEILLVSSRKKKRWVIPKGIVEPDLTPQDSAAKEALEEGGILGEVLPESVGTYTYEKWGGVCRVVVFLLKVTSLEANWLENYRERQWFSLPEARKRLEEAELKNILLKVGDRLS
jgi:8-oxo-dGTP pyrophosphatase MutT (NUDIX family)